MLGLSTAVAGVVGAAALFIYAKSLAARIPDGKLERSTNTVMWGYLIAVGLIRLLEHGQAVAVACKLNAQTVQMVAGCSMMIVAIPGLAFWIWSIVLIFKYRNRLMETAQRARETWAREDLPDRAPQVASTG